MGKAGRKRKPGKRTPSGQLSRAGRLYDTDNGAPTMNPIERAAMALAELDTERDIGWRYYVPEARTVIMAIREPSDIMLEAALETSTRFGKPAMTRIWQAMIDATLTERQK